MEGPYSFVRHPLYLGSFLIGSGIALSFTQLDNFWPTLFFWLFYVAYFWGFYTAAIVSEEALLSQRFPSEWQPYKINTPAFLPFNFLLFKNANFKSFSRAQYLKNKEYNALLGWLAIVILIFVFK